MEVIIQNRSVSWSALLATMCMVAGLWSFSEGAMATGAFARATGAACSKCHTANFPRLNSKGENFMRNGFQLRKQPDMAFSLDDEPAPVAQEQKSGMHLNKISDVFSIEGNMSILKADEDQDNPALAEVDNVVLLATGTIDRDIPFWAGAEIGADGSSSLHRFILGATNVADSTLLNFRIGTIDPTTWTSFYGHGNILDTASPSVGAYSGGAGFTKVGLGYGEGNALEYYGYTDSFIWSLAAANTGGGHAHGGDSTGGSHEEASPYDELDYWLSARYDIIEGASLSLLVYQAAGAEEVQSMTLAGNWQNKALDISFQYSQDDSGDDVLDNRSGYTLQGSYLLHKQWAALLRVDSTDNGAAVDSTESQVTAGVIYKPKENIKFTASWVSETETGVIPHDDTGLPAHEHESEFGGDKFYITVKLMI